MDHNQNRNLTRTLVAAALGLAAISSAHADTYGDLTTCTKANQTSRSEVLNRASKLRSCINTVETGKGLSDPGSYESSNYLTQLGAQTKQEAAASKSNDLNVLLQRCQNNKQSWDSLLADFNQKWKFWGCDNPEATLKARLAKLDAAKGTADKTKADADAKAKADAAAKAKADADAKTKADADAKTKADADAKAKADAAAKTKADADAKTKADADAKAKADAAKGKGDAGAGTQATAGMRKCADDGKICEVSGSWTGKYGAGTKFADIKGTGRFTCLPKGWVKPWQKELPADTGVDDPASGQAKACYVK